MAQRGNAEKKSGRAILPIVWRILRPVLVYLTSGLIVAGLLFTVWTYVDRHYLSPPDQGDETTRRVVVPYGASVRTIATALYDEGLIRNKGVFQYMSEFLGQNSKLKAGSYDLSPSMTVAQIIDALTAGDGGQKTMRFRIVEGLTLEQIAASLVQQEAIDNTSEFLSLCKTGSEFDDIPFVSDLLASQQQGVKYALEGFLFPDTYEIYTDETPAGIIRKMLMRCDDIFNAACFTGAERNDMSMSDVITLASIIEREAKTKDFAKVSAVFHLRLQKGMKLESDVPVKYALGITRLALSAGDLAVQSPYNDYLHGGLPPGPVCAPGRAAMEAAVTPDEGYMADGYLYFLTRDPEAGELQFSKTLEEHNKAKAEYRPLWEEYDRGQAGRASASPNTSATPRASATITPRPSAGPRATASPTRRP